MKAKQGMSKRAYARHAGVDHALIVRLCKENRLPVLADGTLDAQVCDRVRTETTRARISSRRARIMPEPGRPSRILDRRCTGCNGLYSPALAIELRSPDFALFCSRECGLEVAAGKSRTEIQARLRAEFRAGGWTEAELACDSIFDYSPSDGAWNFHK
jgi:hypothetical protein